MILIADSGATKTDWQLLESAEEVKPLKTKGYSPYYLSSEQIFESLDKDLLPRLPSPDRVKEVYFYGTGCSSEELCSIVERALLEAFPKAHLHVEHDLLGAARALCANEAGFACILGTGSNVAFYDGKTIPDHEPNLGFWLGDEGSGAYLGKTLVVDYLYKDMPEHLMQKFEKRFPEVSKVSVVKNAYGGSMPSRYFASFSKFLYDNIKEEYAYKLVRESFSKFFDKYLCKHPYHKKYKAHFIGSIAYYYADILKKVAQSKGLTVGNILETPIQSLVDFHKRT